MPSLRDLRDRIGSVKSTRKITKAMQMVAASKLKKAQEQAQASQAYSQAMGEMTARVAEKVDTSQSDLPLLAGTGSVHTHLVVVVSADRGLCGGFNANIVRRARKFIADLEKDNRAVKIVTVGRKAEGLLSNDHPEKIVKSFADLGGRGGVSFSESEELANYILDQFSAGQFDVCTLIYNEFVSVLAQKPLTQQLIPFKVPQGQEQQAQLEEIGPQALYDFEPSEEAILNDLLPRNISVQIFQALLDSAAGEQAARMTAMDNATRNAGDMIDRLTLQYNRARQAAITKELIEIISGAEAL